MDSQSVALITAAASGLTNGVVSGITMAWPERPKWAAFVLALVFGVVFALIGAVAFLPPAVPFDRQMVGQIIIGGVTAGLGAAGLSVSQASAQARREQATANSTEPDPLTPKANPGGN